MIRYWLGVVLVVHLSLLLELSDAAGTASSTYSADFLEFRCVTPEVPYNSADSVKVYVQKQQFEGGSWVNVNNGSEVVPPFPKDRMDVSVRCDVPSSAGRAMCRANFTIVDAEPVDAAQFHRCQIVSDAANDTGSSHSYLMPLFKSTMDVDLKIIDENSTALEYTSAGKVKVYEIKNTAELQGVTIQCKANGTFKNPTSSHVDSGGQRLGNTVTIVTYSGPAGYATITNDVTTSITDTAKITSMIGKDVVCTAKSYSSSRDDIVSQINIRFQLAPEIACDPIEEREEGDSVELTCTVKGLIPGDDVWWDILEDDGVIASQVRSDIQASDSDGKPVDAKVSLIKHPGEMTYTSWLNVTSAQKGVMYKIYSKNKFGTTEKAVPVSVIANSGIYLCVQWINVVLLLLLGMTM